MEATRDNRTTANQNLGSDIPDRGRFFSKQMSISVAGLAAPNLRISMLSGQEREGVTALALGIARKNEQTAAPSQPKPARVPL